MSAASVATPQSPIQRARAGIDACVHCGFCLQACPTYLALGDENDSPRGRVLLMRLLADGELAPSDESLQTHIDQCLGCRGCETACPSGVPYGELLEATRATIAAARPIAPVARAILAVFRRPALLGLVLWLARAFRRTGLPRLLGRLPGRAGFAMGMLAASERVLGSRPYTRRSREQRGSTAVLEGCVMRGLFADTNRATERTLQANGYAIVDAPGQRCCGALHAHAGDLEGARLLARENVAAFEHADPEWIAVNAAGCGAMMKEYGHLLADDPAWHDRAAAVSAKVRDVSELLAAAGPISGAPLDLRVTYDAPCHLLHAQRVVDAPLVVLRAIPGLTMVPLADADLCCGAAGIYNLLEPELSGRVLSPKVRNIVESNVPLVATGNPGCLMQIGAGLIAVGSSVRVLHPVDLLDASYAAGAREHP